MLLRERPRPCWASGPAGQQSSGDHSPLGKLFSQAKAKEVVRQEGPSGGGTSGKICAHHLPAH